MTFKNFRPGAGSQDAYEACVEFARSAETAPRLLLLDGPIGSGKTHLLHAIAHEFYARHPTAHVACLSGGALMDRLVTAIASDRPADFVSDFTTCHLILIDDLFVLSGRETTTRMVADAVRQWLDAGVRIAGANPGDAAQVARLTDGVAGRWRAVSISRVTEHEVLRILRKRVAGLAIPDRKLRGIARRAHGDVRRALGQLTTTCLRRDSGRAA